MSPTATAKPFDAAGDAGSRRPPAAGAAPTVGAALSRALSHTGRLPLVLGLIHASVDASCAMAVLGATVLHPLGPGHAFYLVVGYNVLAFAGQAPLGALTDRLRMPRGAALVGLVLTALATLAMAFEPVTTTVLAGVGNALFHVGAGAIALRLNPARATAPGVYVAPGALGLALGVWLGRQGWELAWPFTAALVLGMATMALIAVPPGTYGAAAPAGAAPRPAPASPIARPKLVVALLLVSVAVRSLLGFAGGYALPKQATIMFLLAAAAFGGKAVGGLVSDRLGWLETSVGALLLSAPLIAFGGSSAAWVIAGMFLFQMTMPVTLAAMGLVFPHRPAFAFGLPCFALILGALPTFTTALRPYYGPASFMVLIALSAASVYYGLVLLGDRNPVKGRLTRAHA